MPPFDSSETPAKSDARVDANHLAPLDAGAKVGGKAESPVVPHDTAAQHLTSLELVTESGRVVAGARKLRVEIKTSPYGSTDQITYLPDGKIKSLVSTSLGGSTLRENYGYTPGGELLFKQTSWSDGAITFLQYDPTNKGLVSVERTNHLGAKEREQYDSATGRLQLTDTTDLDGIRTVTHYQYDEAGKATTSARQIYDRSGNLTDSFEADSKATEISMLRVSGDSEMAQPLTRTSGDGTARVTEAPLLLAGEQIGERTAPHTEAPSDKLFANDPKGEHEQRTAHGAPRSESGGKGTGAATGAALILGSALSWWQQTHHQEVGHYVSPAN